LGKDHVPKLEKGHLFAASYVPAHTCVDALSVLMKYSQYNGFFAAAIVIIIMCCHPACRIKDPGGSTDMT
jgi:hypothetical protein